MENHLTSADPLSYTINGSGVDLGSSPSQESPLRVTPCSGSRHTLQNVGRLCVQEYQWWSPLSASHISFWKKKKTFYFRFLYKNLIIPGKYKYNGLELDSFSRGIISIDKVWKGDNYWISEMTYINTRTSMLRDKPTWLLYFKKLLCPSKNLLKYVSLEHNRQTICCSQPGVVCIKINLDYFHADQDGSEE